MKYAHLIKLTAFSYEHENNDAILEAFLRFFPFNLDENKVAFNKTNASGFNERKIGVLEITLTKNNLINQFLKNLLDNLDENQRKLISEQLDSRLDKNLDFFLRFDKDLWINEKKLANRLRQMLPYKNQHSCLSKKKRNSFKCAQKLILST